MDRVIIRRAVRLGWRMVFLPSLGLWGQGEIRAQTQPAETASPERHFQRGRYESALINGVFFSPFIATHNRPTIDYTFSSLQFGYMLGDVKGDGWWRGNSELAGEAFGSAVVKGVGTFIAGGTIWLRYNFVPRQIPRLVPFFQGGAGAVCTDIDRGIVGQPFNFNLDLGVGLRYFVG